MNATRTRQPEELRSRILDAAQLILLDEGFSSLTQERVLNMLGISKGGLQHHFRTKAQLLDGLFERLFEAFASEYKHKLDAELDGPAKHIRAYMRMAAQEGEQVKKTGLAITLLAIGEPKYQTEWSEYIKQIREADSVEISVHTACRMFADGLWYGYVVGPEPDRYAATEALNLMIQLTEGK